MSDEVVVEIRDLHKNYGPLEVLKGIDLTVRRGEKVVVLGPSGSGKSTMLRCINALEDADSGSIKVAGQEITDRKININKVREHLGMVFQRFNLWPHKTVIENVMLGQMVVSGKSKKPLKNARLKHWSVWVWQIKPINTRFACQAVSNSAWPLPERLRWTRR